MPAPQAVAQDVQSDPVCMYLQGYAEKLNSKSWSNKIFQSMFVEVDCDEKSYKVNTEITDYTAEGNRLHPEVFDDAMSRHSANICSWGLAELGWIVTIVVRSGGELFRPPLIVECEVVDASPSQDNGS